MSTAALLPGGEPVADYPGVEISPGPGGEVAVISQVESAKHTRAYVARFDGATWSDITPPAAPEWLSPYRPKNGALHLFATTGSFRRSGQGWDAIRIELAEKDDPCSEETLVSFVESSSGAEIFVRGSGGCLWRLPAGGMTAERVRLPVSADAHLESVVELGGWLYILVEKGSTGMLLRLRI